MRNTKNNTVMTTPVDVQIALILAKAQACQEMTKRHDSGSGFVNTLLDMLHIPHASKAKGNQPGMN